MQVRHLLCLLLFLKNYNVFANIVEYYEDLINENMEKAKSFNVPTDNSIFFSNISSAEIKEYGRYDFIVVGAGSAGAVIASRLSEVNKWKVLLLEAGDYENDFTDIPAMKDYLLKSTKNWGYISTPQKNALLGYKNNQQIIPRGKSIGGSTVINHLVYQRCNRKDFNNWELNGNPGWSYNSVLKYFKKSEDSHINGDKGFHSTGGLLPVNYQWEKYPELNKAFLEASNSLGLNQTDYNGISEVGVSLPQVNIAHGKRMSTGRTFIKAAKNRTNLEISINSFVTKVLFNENQATGVEFVKNGVKYKAIASKEIILSAGVVNTPQILILSGIGPKEFLKEINIKVIKDLPVGKYLKNHIIFSYLNFVTNYSFHESHTLKEDIKSYLNGYGPLTSIFNYMVGFLDPDDIKNDYPNLEISLNSNIPDKYNNPPPRDILKKSIIEAFSVLNNKTAFTINIINLHTKSFGEITLKSNNPKDFPKINYNLLSNSDDIEYMYRGIKWALKLVETKPFSKFYPKLVLNLPPCNDYKFKSKEYWYCAIKHLAKGVDHLTGTTRMGPNSKKYVVNYQLKVHGIEKLRIADAGVIPETPTGHISIPVTMIGEKVSDMLKKLYL